MLALLTVTRATVGLVYLPAAANPALKQDVWLALLLGGVLGIPLTWVLSRLWQRFPSQTFPAVAERVLGRWPGRALAAGYAAWLLLLFSLNLRVAGEFFLINFLPRTPVIVLIGGVAFLSAWAAAAGAEVMGRSSQVVLFILINTVVIIFVLLLKDVEFRALTPVLVQSGPLVVFGEAMTVFARTTELVCVGLLVPLVKEPGRLFRSVALALLLTGVLLALVGAVVVATLPDIETLLYFPFFTTARQVSIADFLERIDAVVLATWLFGMFLRGGLLLWGSAVSAAQGLGLADYRPLVIPLTGLAVTLSVMQVASFPELRGYLRAETFMPFALTFVWVMPVLVLAVAALRGLKGEG